MTVRTVFTRNACLEVSSHASSFERHISIESGFLVIQTHDGCEGNLRRPHFTLSWEMQGLSKHGSQEPGKGACSAKASTSPGPSQVWSLPAYHQSLFTSMAISGHLRCALELCCCLASPSLPVFPGRLPTVWYLQQVSSRPLISQQPLFTCLSLPSDPESLEARGGVLINCHPSEFIQESCRMEAYMMCRRG